MTRATDLKQLFSKYGKVIGAKVVTNTRTPGTRCYGYVTMNSTEDANKCIENVHRTELHGRMISVEKAKSDLGLTKSAGTGSKGTSGGGSVKKEPSEGKRSSVSKTSDGDKKAQPKKASEGRDDGKAKGSPKRNADSKASDGESAKRRRDSSADGRRSAATNRGTSRGEVKKSPVRRVSKDREQERARQRQREREREILSYDKIRNERERERLRDKEREIREDERHRREVRRRQREEEERLAKEREKLKLERERLEREKADLLRMERERAKLEREKIELERLEIKRQQMKIEESKRSLKRPASNDRDRYSDTDRKRSAPNDRRFEAPPPPRFDSVISRPSSGYDRVSSSEKKRGDDYRSSKGRSDDYSSSSKRDDYATSKRRDDARSADSRGGSGSRGRTDSDYKASTRHGGYESGKESRYSDHQSGDSRGRTSSYQGGGTRGLGNAASGPANGSSSVDERGSGTKRYLDNQYQSDRGAPTSPWHSPAAPPIKTYNNIQSMSSNDIWNKSSDSGWRNMETTQDRYDRTYNERKSQAVPYIDQPRQNSSFIGRPQDRYSSSMSGRFDGNRF
uniref:RRM domain-containing protein n=2 Tax=Lutzomyia longipalpis TaxID=7200 RepID=A0A1B0CTN0_LUTLO